MGLLRKDFDADPNVLTVSLTRTLHDPPSHTGTRDYDEINLKRL